MPKTLSNCSPVPSTSALTLSILLATGTIARSRSIARKNVAIVCAWMPCAASTSSSAPWQAASDRDTSNEKSACPGVSMRFSRYVSPVRSSAWSKETLCALTVIPRARSTGSRSRYCFLPPGGIAPVISSRRSASVDLPWSTCATMEKLRTLASGTRR